jgi:hypothetical protein
MPKASRIVPDPHGWSSAESILGSAGRHHCPGARSRKETTMPAPRRPRRIWCALAATGLHAAISGAARAVMTWLLDKMTL